MEKLRNSVVPVECAEGLRGVTDSEMGHLVRERVGGLESSPDQPHPTQTKKPVLILFPLLCPCTALQTGQAATALKSGDLRLTPGHWVLVFIFRDSSILLPDSPSILLFPSLSSLESPPSF